jgi:hypothetical protein
MSTQPNATTSEGLYSSGADNEVILDKIGEEVLDSHAPAAGGETADGSLAPAAADGAAADGAVAAPAEVPAWMETAPPELKALLAQGNVSADTKKWLQEIYGDLHGFKETPFGTKEAIGEIVEMFPGGMDEIKEAQQNAATFVTEMSQFRSGDPIEQAELISNLLTNETADAFVSFVGVAADMLKQTLRDDYTAFAGRITRQHVDDVTDGNFSKYGESTSAIAAAYNSAVASGDEAAQNKLAGQLAGAALQYASWWNGSAKTKLGYGEQPAAATTGSRPQVVSKNGVDENDQSVIYAKKDAGYFQMNYEMGHDNMVNPMISAMLTRDLGVRKLDLPESWKKDVSSFVASGVKKGLDADPTFVALVNKVYKRGSVSDPRKWDNSDKTKGVLLAAVKQRAEKLLPSLMKQALDRVAELRGASVTPPPKPGAGTRSSAGGPTASAGDKSGGNWKDKIKRGEISNEQALSELLNLG